MLRKVNFFFLLLAFNLLYCASSFAQKGSLSGVVKDDQGQPVFGASVALSNTTIGTTTDLDGNYFLDDLPAGENVFLCRFVGFIPKEASVVISSGTSATLDFLLLEDAEVMEELVVIGYGTEKKSLLTGTISKIEAKDITQGAVRDAAESLQGRAAGVLVQSTSGQPGAGLSINIRGVSTSGNSQPLYIVDGMPVDDIAFLNPSDIKSMEVLKDAAAASIYGARGGNGVVIITTTGTAIKGKVTLKYDTYAGIQNPWRKAEVLNAKEYAMASNEAARNDGQSVPFDLDNLAGATDWWDEIRNMNAPVMNHSLSIAGGNDVTFSTASLSYFSQEGTFAPDHSNYDRFTARVNTTHNLGILKMGHSLSYTNSNYKGFNPNDSYDNGAMIVAVMNYDPTAPIYGEDGDYYHSEYRTGEYTNPVAKLPHLNNENSTNRILGNVFAELELMKGLVYRTSGSIDAGFVSVSTFTPEYEFTPELKNPSPSAYQQMSKSVQWQLENTLSYTREFSKHRLSVLIGQTVLEKEQYTLWGSAANLQFNDPEKNYLSNTLDAEGTRAGDNVGLYRLNSYFGRLSYNYKEKYIMTAVVRSDASSNFGANNRYGVFPSVSAGWVMSKEEFFPQTNVVNFAKLRASWGQNGNDRIPAFGYLPLLEIRAYNIGASQGSTPAMSPRAIANPDLKWEAIEQFNVGADLGFLDNRLRLAADYYIKQTKDILIVPDIAAHCAAGPPPFNGGDVENKGVELELSFKNSVKEFNYNVALTYAYNKNTITSINNENKCIYGASANASMPNVTLAKEGYAINSFFGYKSTGVFQSDAEVAAYVNENGEKIQPNAKAGDLIFQDTNKNGTIDDDDRVILGDPIPDHTLGFNFGMEWKGFDVSAFLYCALGYQNFNTVHRHDYVYQNYLSSMIEDRWMGAGSTNTNPRLTVEDPNGNYTKPNSFMVEDADMIRLKKLSLGYTLPQDLTQRISIQKLRIYVAAENLLTFTKYSGLDPEIGSTASADPANGSSGTTNPSQTLDRGIDRGVYPASKTFMLGLNLSF